MPSAPDCDANPIWPADRPERRERRVHRDVGIGVDDAHAVRPDESHPVAAGELDELLLDLGAAPLGEPGADHDEAVHALLRALVHHLRRPTRRGR